MDGPAKAKHRNKRVGRFLGNEHLEQSAISAALFRTTCPTSAQVVVLVDWTARHAWQQLTFGGALRRARARRSDDCCRAQSDQGVHAICPFGVTPQLIGDRGFGNMAFGRCTPGMALRPTLFLSTHGLRLATHRHPPGTGDASRMACARLWQGNGDRQTVRAISFGQRI